MTISFPFSFFLPELSEDVESIWSTDGLEPLIVGEGAAAVSPKNGVTEPEEGKTKADSTPGQKVGPV